MGSEKKARSSQCPQNLRILLGISLTPQKLCFHPHQCETSQKYTLSLGNSTGFHFCSSQSQPLLIDTAWSELARLSGRKGQQLSLLWLYYLLLSYPISPSVLSQTPGHHLAEVSLK